MVSIAIIGSILTGCAASPSIQHSLSPTQAASEQITETKTPFLPTRETSKPIIATHPDKISTSTPDPGHQATLEAQTTLSAYWDSVVATEMAALPLCGFPERSYDSPDGNWVAIDCINRLTGIYNRKDPSKTWQVSYYDAFGNVYDQGNADGKLIPVHWSGDGRYIYLMPRPCCLDGGGGEYYDGLALLRLDLSSGKITQTLPPSQGLGFYDVSFSKDGEDLAYIKTWIEKPVVNISNLISGEELQLPLNGNFNGAGDVVWSPDKSHVILSGRTSNDFGVPGFSLVMIELHNSKQVILKDHLEYYRPLDWTTDNKVLLEKSFSEEYYSLDLNTMNITPDTLPTPTPVPP